MIALALTLLTLFPQGPEEVLKVNGPHPATTQSRHVHPVDGRSHGGPRHLFQ